MRPCLGISTITEKFGRLKNWPLAKKLKQQQQQQLFFTRAKLESLLILICCLFILNYFYCLLITYFANFGHFCLFIFIALQWQQLASQFCEGFHCNNCAFAGFYLRWLSVHIKKLSVNCSLYVQISCNSSSLLASRNPQRWACHNNNRVGVPKYTVHLCSLKDRI